jgi:hypothetical protein
MNLNPLRTLTDIIYEELFGKNTLALLVQFQLPLSEILSKEDTLLRDNLGELALKALGDIETKVAPYFRQFAKKNIAWDVVQELVAYHAIEISNEYKAQAAAQGIDLLTGERL